jgi:HAD superfamily hydrolase (TIGR01509 family)
LHDVTVADAVGSAKPSRIGRSACRNLSQKLILRHGRPATNFRAMIPDLVIFDCDGVLIDSELIACRVDAACLVEIGYAITVEDILDRYVGLSAATMLADLETRSGEKLPADFAETLRRRLAATFDAELAAMPGIAAVLGRLRCRSCVASSSAPERLRHSLSLVGLFHRFDPNIFSATEVRHGKPAPDLFLHAACRMGVAPQRCIVIEDSIAEVRAARAAKMTVFGFAGGGHCRPGHAERLQREGASIVFADMTQLPALLGSVSPI